MLSIGVQTENVIDAACPTEGGAVLRKVYQRTE